MAVDRLDALVCACSFVDVVAIDLGVAFDVDAAPCSVLARPFKYFIYIYKKTLLKKCIYVVFIVIGVAMFCILLFAASLLLALVVAAISEMPFDCAFD